MATVFLYVAVILGLAFVFAVGFVAGRHALRESGVPLIGGDDDELQPGSIFGNGPTGMTGDEVALADRSELWAMDVSFAPACEGPWSEPLTKHVWLQGVLEDPPDEWSECHPFAGKDAYVRIRYRPMAERA